MSSDEGYPLTWTSFLVCTVFYYDEQIRGQMLSTVDTMIKASEHRMKGEIAVCPIRYSEGSEERKFLVA